MLDNNKIQLLKYGSLILFGAGTYIICRSLTCLQALKILQPRSVVYISRALKHNIRIIDKYLNHQIDITKKKLNIKEEKSTRARVKNISLFNAKVLISTECRTVNFHIYKQEKEKEQFCFYSLITKLMLVRIKITKHPQTGILT